MPYTKSHARVEFDSTIEKYKSLAKSTEKISNKILSYDHKSMIFQSIIVALSSAMEEYHNNILDLMFYNMRIKGIRMGQLPINSRLLHVLSITSECTRGYLYDRDGEANTLCKLFDRKTELKRLIDDDELFDIPSFYKSIIGDKKYPSERNLKTLYSRLGVKDIFAVLHAKGHKNYKILLRSFGDLRSAIAHVGGKDVTYKDVKEQIVFVSDFVYMLDKELYSICLSSSGRSCWPV